MIGNWLSGVMQGRAEQAAAREVQRFVDGLARMPDRDLGVVVGIAAVVRVNMETHGILPERLFESDGLPSPRELGVLQWRINGVARDFTKARQTADATGAMIWSYSLRCLNLPVLRPLGRAMWAELRRGFPHVEEALDEGEERLGRKFDARVWAEWAIVPLGLEPDGPPSRSDG